MEKYHPLCQDLGRLNRDLGKAGWLASHIKNMHLYKVFWTMARSRLSSPPYEQPLTIIISELLVSASGIIRPLYLNTNTKLIVSLSRLSFKIKIWFKYGQQERRLISKRFHRRRRASKIYHLSALTEVSSPQRGDENMWLAHRSSRDPALMTAPLFI